MLGFLKDLELFCVLSLIFTAFYALSIIGKCASTHLFAFLRSMDSQGQVLDPPPKKKCSRKKGPTIKEQVSKKWKTDNTVFFLILSSNHKVEILYKTVILIS